MAVDIIVLAAGKGTRMHSSHPKVLHCIGGKPMLRHVVDTADSLSPRQITIVGGHQYEEVKSALADKTGLHWINQQQQLGTGHAVLQALDTLDPDGESLILYGDVPLIKAQTIGRLLSALKQHEVVILTAEVPDPAGLGRILRAKDGTVMAIIEDKDASEHQRTIHEINSGILAVTNRFLLSACPALKNNNQQGEYYLTDLVAMARHAGYSVAAVKSDDLDEIQGVNDRYQLAMLERRYQIKKVTELALKGVTFSDMERVDIRGEVDIDQDVEIDVNVILSGNVSIGKGTRIGANCVIRDSVIGENSVIEDFSHINASVIGEKCRVGPYARLRPGTILESSARIGNFVETKKSRIGSGSKVNHLSYIGDTEMGDQVNVGAGTITCNYDGANKHQTVIGNRVFIGSNSALVAPLTISDDATVGAGSVVCADVDQAELVVARVRQKHIKDWKRPVKNKPGNEG